MQDLNVTVVQSDIVWAAKDENIARLDAKLSGLEAQNGLVVLPEMFTTGFNMKPNTCYEEMDGTSMAWMHRKASALNSVVCGSLLIKEHSDFVNRFIWMQPDGNYLYSDKKHLFRMAGENTVFKPGNSRIIATAGGFRFLLLVCYDLRFPVWSRNTYKNESYAYDAIIYTANWPASRNYVWKTLLMARAMENQAFVIGVNRIGKDFNGTAHSGNSTVVSPKGEIICEAPQNEEAVLTVTMNKESLDTYRASFLNAADWDSFELKH